ncbi:MAG: hypothetical protein V1929_13125 [bacterium]
MKDIYFKCRSCRKQLVVAASAAGFSAECPNCRTSLIIPTRSSLPPKVRQWTGLIAANVALIAVLTAVGVYVISGYYRSKLPAFARIPVAITSVATSEPAGEKTEPVTAIDEAVLAHQKELEEANAALSSNYQQLKLQFDDLGNWVLDNVQGKFPLAERLLSKLRLSPVTEDYTVNPDVVELLKINGREESMINDAFQYTHGSIAQLEAALIQVTEATPGKVTLYVPPFEKEGQAIKEDLFYALEATLGGPRFDRFHDVTQEELETSFDHFGTASRTLVFEVTYPPDGQSDPYLVIKDGWILPEGQSSRSVNVKETAVREMPEAYLAYVSLLPQTIASYAVK